MDQRKITPLARSPSEPPGEEPAVSARVDVAAALADRRRYERQIERLHHRHLQSGRLYEIRQDDVTLASVVMHRGRVARLLARDVDRGRYVLEPGELRTIRVRNKEREV